jgi:hypothetical protein
VLVDDGQDDDSGSSHESPGEEDNLSVSCPASGRGLAGWSLSGQQSIFFSGSLVVVRRRAARQHGFLVSSHSGVKEEDRRNLSDKSVKDEMVTAESS